MMLEHMAACLSGGGRIEIRGFGSFSLRFRRARLGRNPRTGAPVSLPGRYAPYFKPGKNLRNASIGKTSHLRKRRSALDDQTIRTAVPIAIAGRYGLS